MRKFIICALLLLHGTCFAKYYSQIGQDKFVHENYFEGYKSGVFVDIGAHNGVTFSNTYFFEKQGWKGICIEPMPKTYAELAKNRSCICVQGCVCDRSGQGQFLKVNCPFVKTEMLSGLMDKYDPRHLERVLKEIAFYNCTYELIDVRCYLLNELLEKNGFDHIDFLSIDTEGGEFEILSTIDFDRYRINVITLEDNYQDSRFVPFLEEKGFRFVKRLEWDLLFVHEDFIPFKKSH